MTQNRSISPKFLLFVLAVAVAAGALSTTLKVWLLPHARARQVPEQLQGILLDKTKPVPAFRLTAHDGTTVTRESLAGRWHFLFFGYTHCPDICPTAMGDMAAVFTNLEAHPGLLDTTRMLFVSVDPDRDTPESLKQFVPYFRADFLGLTGHIGEIENLTRALGAGFRKIPDKEGEGYQVGHTTSVFLLDPEVRLTALFHPPAHDTQLIAERFVAIRDLYAKEKQP
ncbi:MAG: SCO family protein [Magnetococcales bacterium]|nr:SCO family protein [Magnetococcales bacterium]MBF0156552.1 SCO family protein [Magnetococcales bacterium]